MFNETLSFKIWLKPDLGVPPTEKQRTAVCRDMKHRVIKVIRPSLASVLPLLKVSDAQPSKLTSYPQNLTLISSWN